MSTTIEIAREIVAQIRGEDIDALEGKQLRALKYQIWRYNISLSNAIPGLACGKCGHFFYACVHGRESYVSGLDDDDAKQKLKNIRQSLIDRQMANHKFQAPK